LLNTHAMSNKSPSKKRVKDALALRVPDRIPFGEFAIDFDTAERIIGHETYHRAKAKSQIALWEGRRDEVVQSWKEDAVELYRKLDILDIVTVSLAPPRDYEPDPPMKIGDGVWEDRHGRIYRYSDVTQDITCVHDPVAEAYVPRMEEFTGEVEVSAPDPSVFEVVDAVIAALGDEKYIAGPSGGEIGIVYLGGQENGMVAMIQHPDIVRAAADRELEIQNQNDQWYIRPGQDGVLWGFDFGYNTGPFISPRMFRELFLELNKARVENIHRVYGMPVLKHACGNNWAYMDMFIEMGYDCYQSIQASAGMDLAALKARYGGRICLWGGVPVETLVSGTPDEVRRDVRHAVESAKEGGGYIFGSTHSIAVGTKYDNFMAMLDEFVRWRGY